MIRQQVTVGAAFVVALTVVGCGSGADLSAPAAAVLQRDTAAVAAAARVGDLPRTSAALTRLRADVAQRRAHGEMSPERARRLLDAAARVALDVVAAHPSPPPSPAPAPASPAQPATAGSGGEGD
ncbi:MAG: hypothetical protein NVSMB55_28410 [Mycobacteriales bacterium]